MKPTQHCLSVYTRLDTNEKLAESWIQINAFGRRLILWKRREKIRG